MEWAQQPPVLIGGHSASDITDELGQRRPVLEPLLLGREIGRIFVHDERRALSVSRCASVPATPENNW